MCDFTTALQVTADFQKLLGLAKCGLCGCIFALCDHQPIEGLCHGDSQTSAGNFQFRSSSSFQSAGAAQVLNLPTTQVDDLVRVALTHIFMHCIVSNENTSWCAIGLCIEELCVICHRWEQRGLRLDFILVGQTQVSSRGKELRHILGC